MAHGESEGFGYVIEQFNHVMQKGVEYAGKAIGGGVSLLGALAAMIPIPGAESIGNAVAALGALGSRSETNEQHMALAPSASPGKAQSQVNDYNPATPEVIKLAMAIPSPSISSEWVEASRDPMGGYKPIAGLPDRVSPSRGQSSSIGFG